MTSCKNCFTGRDISLTNYMNDSAIAINFYKCFSVPLNFGKVVKNREFDKWIRELGFKHMSHGFETAQEINIWNKHRNTIRDYIKNGVCSKEYADSGYEPYYIESNKHGESLIIVKFSDALISACNGLANKRQKNIKYKNKQIMKGFKVIKYNYKDDSIEHVMQEQIIAMQNKMRLGFEKMCGEIQKTTIQDTLALVEKQKKQMSDLSKKYFSIDSDNDEI